MQQRVRHQRHQRHGEPRVCGRQPRNHNPTTKSAEDRQQDKEVNPHQKHGPQRRAGHESPQPRGLPPASQRASPTDPPRTGTASAPLSSDSGRTRPAARSPAAPSAAAPPAHPPSSTADEHDGQSCRAHPQPVTAAPPLCPRNGRGRQDKPQRLPHRMQRIKLRRDLPGGRIRRVEAGEQIGRSNGITRQRSQDGRTQRRVQAASVSSDKPKAPFLRNLRAQAHIHARVRAAEDVSRAAEKTSHAAAINHNPSQAPYGAESPSLRCAELLPPVYARLQREPCLFHSRPTQAARPHPATAATIAQARKEVHLGQHQCQPTQSAARPASAPQRPPVQPRPGIATSGNCTSSSSPTTAVATSSSTTTNALTIKFSRKIGRPTVDFRAATDRRRPPSPARATARAYACAASPISRAQLRRRDQLLQRLPTAPHHRAAGHAGPRPAAVRHTSHVIDHQRPSRHQGPQRRGRCLAHCRIAQIDHHIRGLYPAHKRRQGRAQSRPHVPPPADQSRRSGHPKARPALRSPTSR